MKKLLSSVCVAFALIFSSCNYQKIMNIQACDDHQFYPKNYQKDIKYGEKEVSSNPSNPKAYYQLGIAYAIAGQPDEAIVNFREALKYVSNYKDMMYIYTWLANEYEELAENQHQEGNSFFHYNVLEYLTKSLELAEQFRDVDIGKVDAVIWGDMYTDVASGADASFLDSLLGNSMTSDYYYSEALKYYNNALELGEHKTGVTYFDIAQLYLDKNEYGMAIKYLKKSY